MYHPLQAKQSPAHPLLYIFGNNESHKWQFPEQAQKRARHRQITSADARWPSWLKTALSTHQTFGFPCFPRISHRVRGGFGFDRDCSSDLWACEAGGAQLCPFSNGSSWSLRTSRSDSLCKFLAAFGMLHNDPSSNGPHA